MTLAIGSPSEIYQRVNSELSNIVSSLNKQSMDETLNQAQKDARTLLERLKKELQTQLTELEKNAEWHTLTIAFYGETGSGKSTIIETLRILLQERSKVANQREFRELRDRYGLNEEKSQQLLELIGKVDGRLDELTQQLNLTLQRYKQPYLDAKQAIEKAKRTQSELTQHLVNELQEREQSYADSLAAVSKLQALIKERKRAASLWQKILNVFRKTPEEIELQQANRKRSAIKAIRDDSRAALTSEESKARQNIRTLEQQKTKILKDRYEACQKLREEQADNERNKKALTDQYESFVSQMAEVMAELEKYADGAIIGDGRADFTRETQSYTFELDGQPFILLDVPGIEGNESIVRDKIEQAVQTAHAVFYVTNQAAPPQTGDKRQGTLEKIKEHLNAQTEVWTIFNKKITNPRYALSDRPLTSDDENSSLNGLNEKMREQLGENYREVFALSALSAFLVSTDHFAAGSQNARRRSKILEDFSSEELLEKSRIRAFLCLLRDQLICDSNSKIIRSNFNKAKEALDRTRSTLSDVQVTFSELAEKLEQDGQSAQIQLESSLKSLKLRLEAAAETLLDHFESSIRREMYVSIDGSIDNSAFKDLLKSTIEKQQEVLIQELPESMEKQIQHFQQDAEDILKRFEEQARELTGIYANLNSLRLNDEFYLKLNIDSGLKATRLIAALGGGAALLWWNPAGWVIGAVAVVTIVVAFYKSVRGFLSSKYKKSQQRKAVDENLRKITAGIRDSLHDGLKNAMPDMQKVVSQLEMALAAPAKQTRGLVESLAHSNDQFEILAQQVKSTGKL